MRGLLLHWPPFSHQTQWACRKAASYFHSHISQRSQGCSTPWRPTFHSLLDHSGFALDRPWTQWAKNSRLTMMLFFTPHPAPPPLRLTYISEGTRGHANAHGSPRQNRKAAPKYSTTMVLFFPFVNRPPRVKAIPQKSPMAAHFGKNREYKWSWAGLSNCVSFHLRVRLSDVFVYV